MLPAFAAGELAAVAARLHADFPTVAGKRLILVYPSGALLLIRAWPFESYVELCAGLLADGYAVGDRHEGRPPTRPGAGQTLRASVLHRPDRLYPKSVRELLALFNRGALLITNDGGPGQFAALTPIPSIVFGPETPQLYRSLSANAHCFHTPLCCSPCLTAYNHRARRATATTSASSRFPPSGFWPRPAKCLPRRRNRAHDAARLPLRWPSVQYLLQHRFKFGLVDGLGVFVNLAVLYVAQEYLFAFIASVGMRLNASLVVAIFFATVNNFKCRNRAWTWRDRKHLHRHRSRLTQFGQYAVACWLGITLQIVFTKVLVAYFPTT